MGIADLGFSGHLSGPALTPKLDTNLVDLTQPGGSHRLAVGEAATIRIDRQAPGDFRGTFRQPLLLITVSAETVLRHVHDYSPHLGILQLRNINILRAHPGQLECGLGGSYRR